MDRRAVPQHERRRKVDHQGLRVRDLLLVPNLLTLSRLVLATPAVILIARGDYGGSHHLALALLLAAFVTDLLDGTAARLLRQKSEMGIILDPIIDKIVVISTTVALTFGDGPTTLPVWMLLAIVVRDGTILLLASRALREDHHLFTSGWSGKAATFGIASTLLLYLLPGLVPHTLLDLLPWVVIGLLLLSSIDYAERYWSVRHKRFVLRDDEAAPPEDIPR